MGIFVVCQICKNTVDFNRIEDHTEHLICSRCLNKVPSHVPISQQYYWLKKNKQDKKSSKLSR